MTEEEYFRKHYPDFCYGDRLLSPYWDLFQYGVEFGERQSEKKINKAKEILQLFLKLKITPCASGNSINMFQFENVCKQAEQFLKGEQQDKWVNPITTTNDPFIR